MKGTIFLAQGTAIATVDVECQGDAFEGTVLEWIDSSSVTDIFREYEMAVLSQLFTRVDVLDDAIAQLCPHLLSDDGRKLEVDDLQLYPEQRGVSFRLLGACTPDALEVRMNGRKAPDVAPGIPPVFSSDPAEYEANERFWLAQWDRCGPQNDWFTPWLRTTFANGQPMRDGNPIFSALSRRRSRALKVIQAEPDDSPATVSTWVKEMEDEDGSTIHCLAIHCVLTEHTSEEASSLMRRWLVYEGDPTLFEVGRDDPR